MKKENETIVAFHIGRGGRYYNAGHKTFIGKKNIYKMLALNDEYVFYNEDTDAYDNCNGNEIITQEDADSGVGILNWDEDYDTDICRYLSDCSQEDLFIIYKSDEYDKEDVIKEYFNKCTDLNVDWDKFNGEYANLIYDWFENTTTQIEEYYENIL